MLFYFFFFFKQKTAYEITYGEWSSDVCSSDLRRRRSPTRAAPRRPRLRATVRRDRDSPSLVHSWCASLRSREQPAEDQVTRHIDHEWPERQLQCQVEPRRHPGLNRVLPRSEHPVQVHGGSRIGGRRRGARGEEVAQRQQ